MSHLLYSSIFSITFVIMEFLAWFLHKYVMHGFLWVLHYDHHNPPKNRSYQLNDFFALFFAIPSFLFILSDHLFDIKVLGAIGFGIMAYGAAYFFIHEVVIHRRFKFFTIKSNRYFRGLNAAHKIHHSVSGKYGCSNFGMLVVPLQYFKKRIEK